MFVAGAAILVADGATWRAIFSHLRIDRDVLSMCKWNVNRILLTRSGVRHPGMRS